MVLKADEKASSRENKGKIQKRILDWLVSKGNGFPAHTRHRVERRRMRDGHSETKIMVDNIKFTN